MLLGVTIICCFLKLLWWYIPLEGYDTIYFIYSIDRHLGCFQFGASINESATNIGGHTPSFSLSIYLEVELMVSGMGRILACVDTAKQFSKVFVSIYTYQQCMTVCQYLVLSKSLTF